MMQRLTVSFFQGGGGIRGYKVTGVQTCALPICSGCNVVSPWGSALDSPADGGWKEPGRVGGGSTRNGRTGRSFGICRSYDCPGFRPGAPSAPTPFLGAGRCLAFWPESGRAFHYLSPNSRWTAEGHILLAGECGGRFGGYIVATRPVGAVASLRVGRSPSR